ncbi:putative Ig domain-containing protein [Pseudomarimonas salicorniae]|uniref:Ig domain-containing protein n=1 Tax=Pseudomarimonas salicorniae TaxID=2933270 RepID=A0ABT0GHG1_9GAMM|nr:putative Ig domain-containing protein [Lysobacter sp. CAU 1642]MCK7593971.1 putative Ig domain-containing protein [Lysobacter sp. CAU 1642]
MSRQRWATPLAWLALVAMGGSGPALSRGLETGTVAVSAEQRSALREALDKALSAGTRLEAASNGDGAVGDQFGVSVAVDGNTALIGAWRDTVGDRPHQGSAYVFVRDGQEWVLQAKLIAEDGNASDQFGYAVALDGDDALVGALYDDVDARTDQGSAYVFRRTGESWQQIQKLTADGGEAGSLFGSAVALQGSTALIGAFGATVDGRGNQGAAYVFQRFGSGWHQQARLTAADGEANDMFGTAVALDLETALVGAPFDRVGSNSWQGSAYLFTRADSEWSQYQRVTAIDGAFNDQFGSAVALKGSLALIGAPADDVGGVPDQGSGYVFQKNGPTWQQMTRLNPADGAQGDQFGSALAITEFAWAISAPFARQQRGAIYTYKLDESGAWPPHMTLAASDAEDGDYFGRSVALSQTELLSGVYLDDVDGQVDQGSVRMFSKIGANWHDQGRLDSGQGAGGRRLGEVLALDGDTAVVGLPSATVAGRPGQGEVLLFARQDDAWREFQRLHLEDGNSGDGFGSAAALLGDTLLIGAPGEDALGDSDRGAVHVFLRIDGSFVAQGRLLAEDGLPGDAFGGALALSADHALIGAAYRDHDTLEDVGAVYAFERLDGGFSPTQLLVPLAYQENQRIGSALSISAGRLLAGAPGYNDGEGAAYVFAKAGMAWQQQARLQASGGVPGDQFGSAVSLDGDTALIGAPFTVIGAHVAQGAALVFHHDGQAWVEETRLTDPAGSGQDHFGSAVAISGEAALISAPGADGTLADQGAVILFARRQSGWALHATLLEAQGRTSAAFGRALAVAQDRVLIGAPGSNSGPPFGNPDEGAAYIFDGVAPRQRTATSFTAQTPVSASVATWTVVEALVSGEQAEPQGGELTVTASSGESCQDPISTDDPGYGLRFACSLRFSTPGPRTLVAHYSGSPDHQSSESSPWPLQVDATLTVTPGVLPSAIVGQMYHQVLGASGQGSRAPYRFAVVEGALPAGLSLDPTSGLLDGVPTVAGGYTFTVEARDGSGAELGGPFSGRRGFNLAVLAGGSPPRIVVASRLTMLEDESGVVLPIDISDAETPASGLSLSITSSDQAIISDAALAAGLGGVAGQRQLRLQTGTDANGLALLQLTVRDADGQTGLATVELQVMAVNDPPQVRFGPNQYWPVGTPGPHEVGDFIVSANPGPADEAGQQISFSAAISDDPDAVLTSVSLSESRGLSYVLSGNPGVATVTLGATDDGGDANGGIAVATPRALRIVVSDRSDLSVSIRRQLPKAAVLGEALAKGSTLASYHIEVLNHGPVAASEVLLQVTPRSGLSRVTWTCTVAGATCRPPFGAGPAVTRLDLAVGQTALIELDGVIEPTQNFVEISARATGSGSVLLPEDDRATLIEPANGTAIYRGGFE